MKNLLDSLAILAVFGGVPLCWAVASMIRLWATHRFGGPADD